MILFKKEKSSDNSLALQQQVKDAYGLSSPLVINGSGSKSFYGHTIEGQGLEVSTHHGIIDYQPTELVLSARAGTKLKDIEAVLHEQGQMLSCDVPHFGENATFGGMIATGLSGPARPFGGSIADLILGCTIINGKGEKLHFGGKVMKNVAGYDVSRLMVGSMGCLGVILDATIKVVPKPPAQKSFRFKVSVTNIKHFMNQLSSLGFPVTASAFDHNLGDNCLMVRFNAGENEIQNIDQLLNDSFPKIDFIKEDDQLYWQRLKEHENDFFKSKENIWRISIAPHAPHLVLNGDYLIEWNGALRWLKTDIKAGEIFYQVNKAGGSASLFYPKNKSAEIFQPLPKALLHWHQQLKHAFDPAGILNPGKMYKEF